ncbi:MAG: chemotaxis protein CheW [Planctomycetes bacterium]|nr:chemotaxis protein CheW [Planctomycetota bacterium]
MADVLQAVAFSIGGEEFVLDIACVEQIIRAVPVTRVPRMPEHVLGVINVRGKVVPVISGASRIGLEGDEKPRRVILCSREGRRAGLLVDNVKELLRIPRDLLFPPPTVMGGMNAVLVQAVVRLDERLLILLCPEILDEATSRPAAA